jgi:hypothetical protein
MERRQFDHVVDQLKNLTKRQREKLVAMLTEGLKRDRTEELIEQAVRHGSSAHAVARASFTGTE